ncbi:MAG: cytidylate kinase-like family protein [Proteobacteria bacterium]|nr:cytidylate kinase-like family protein [Pseudomonadota bacterium]
MQIICISRGSYGFSSTLSEQLAEKLGYACVSRESLTDKATDYGIPVGKIEIDILKNKPITEERSINIDLFKSFVTSELCSMAQKKGVVYHGRAGHLVLPGLPNVLRVRAIDDPENRIKTAMSKLNLDRKKAKQYIEQTDDDIRRWVRILYKEDWENPSLYDLTVNAYHMSAQSVSHFLLQVAKLPEFQPTPSSNQTISDLILASKCRLAIGNHDQTRQAKVTLKAEKGHVSVSYLPRQAMEAKAIPQILESVPGVSSFVCTVASTNILLLGETFDSKAEHMNHLIDIAEKWNAAVEIVQLSSDVQKEDEIQASAPMDSTGEPDGGILEENEEAPKALASDQGLTETMNRLIEVGRAGCSHTSHGGVGGLVKDISKNVEYSLIVVGDMFSAKGVAKQRLKRDLVSMMTDKFSCPVLSAEDLKSRYLFGKKQMIGLVTSAFFSAMIYLVIFGFQKPIIKFVSAGQLGGTMSQKIASAVVVAICVPVIALVIGGFYHNFLKMIRLE